MAKLRRNYYNNGEFNNFMVMAAMLQMMEGIRGMGGAIGEPMAENYYNKGIITKEQRKNLKMSYTYLKKFMIETYDNADIKTRNKMDKKLLNFDFRLVDDYSVKKIYEILNSTEEYRLSKEDFYLLVTKQVESGCADCVEDRNTCKMHDLFEKYLIRPQHRGCGNLPNCEYAFLKEIE